MFLLLLSLLVQGPLDPLLFAVAPWAPIAVWFPGLWFLRG